MKALYHGTIYDIEKIDVTQGKGYKDFGKGFYATSVKSHADNIARRNKRMVEAKEAKIKIRNPDFKTGVYLAYRYNLEFDDSCITALKDLNIKIFQNADKEWMRFVLKNRESDQSMHEYDIVIGPTADENTVTVINSYREVLMETHYDDKVLEALIKELQPENLPKQYFFGTNTAIQYLCFQKVKREIVG